MMSSGVSTSASGSERDRPHLWRPVPSRRHVAPVATSTWSAPSSATVSGCHVAFEIERDIRHLVDLQQPPVAHPAPGGETGQPALAGHAATRFGRAVGERHLVSRAGPGRAPPRGPQDLRRPRGHVHLFRFGRILSGCQPRRHSSPMVGFCVQRSGVMVKSLVTQMLQPMHSRMSSRRPSSIFFGRKGSAIEGRAAPIMSMMPWRMTRTMESGEV